MVYPYFLLISCHFCNGYYLLCEHKMHIYIRMSRSVSKRVTFMEVRIIKLGFFFIRPLYPLVKFSAVSLILREIRLDLHITFLSSLIPTACKNPKTISIFLSFQPTSVYTKHSYWLLFFPHIYSKKGPFHLRLIKSLAKWHVSKLFIYN